MHPYRLVRIRGMMYVVRTKAKTKASKAIKAIKSVETLSYQPRNMLRPFVMCRDEGVFMRRPGPRQ